ncbi:MAG: SDR family oxidoreductase [Acidimicrobiia bacterium]|nr:SDR family oxidoreductase [Acidimicrobiia bacterium]
MSGNVLVVIGAGGMGMAIARRCGKDSIVMLADIGEVSSALADEAYDVRTQQVDVSDLISVAALAKAAAELGPVQSVVHTAGLSPVQSLADRVIAVDLLGTAHVIDAFGPVIAAGGAAVVISSMAGHLTGGLPAADEAAIAAADAADLAALPCVRAAAAGDPGLAYAFAKAAVSALVRAAAQPWGRRGARINAISPGVIDTTMGQAELDGPSGDFMRTMVEASGSGRLGAPDDIAAATEFLLSPNAAFITGADLLVDGGVVAAVRSGQLG